MTRISQEHKSSRIKDTWPNGAELLKTAVLLDVDGTLVGPYKDGKRKIRPSALTAIKILSQHSTLFLWSVVPGNAERLISEFPELTAYVCACYAQDEFPFHAVETVFCIDDEEVAPVLQYNHVIVDTYDGGPDSGLLLEAAEMIVQHILNTTT